MTEIILKENIDISLDKSRFLKAVRADLLEDDTLCEIEKIFSIATDSLRPSFCGIKAEIQSFASYNGIYEAKIEGETFKGRILEKLENKKQVVLYYVTCGTQLENHDCNRDPLFEFAIDTIKEHALDEALLKAKNIFEDSLSCCNISSINPESGNRNLWDINELEKEFRIFEKHNCLRNIKLTKSCLMLPNKSICGIFFPSEEEFRTCYVCNKTNCPRRNVFS